MQLIGNLVIPSFEDIDSEDEMVLDENIHDLVQAEEVEMNKYRNLKSDEEGDDEEEEDSMDDEDEGDYGDRVGRGGYSHEINNELETKIEF